MRFVVTHVEPGDGPSQVVVKGEYRQFVSVIADLDPTVTASLKSNGGGMRDTRIGDAIAASVAGAVSEAIGSCDRKRDVYTGTTFDNSPCGKVKRLLRGGELKVDPDPERPVVAAAPTIVTDVPGDVQVSADEAAPADSSGTELPQETQVATPAPEPAVVNAGAPAPEKAAAPPVVPVV